MSSVSAVQVAGYQTRVTVTIDTAGVTAMTVYRVNPDGAAVPVMAAYNVVAVSGAWDDPEVPLDVPVKYRVNGDNGKLLIESAAVTVNSAGYPILSDPYTGVQVAVSIIAGSREKRFASRVTTVDVEGRPDPVVLWDVESAARIPEIRLLTRTAAADAAMDTLCAPGSPLLLRAPCAGVPDRWLQRVGERASVDFLESRTSATRIHTFTDLVRLSGTWRPGDRPFGDTLADLDAAVGSTTLQAIADRWSTLLEIASADLKSGTGGANPVPEPEPTPPPDPLPATPAAVVYSLTPGVYSSDLSTFDMLEAGQLTSGFAYKRDPGGVPYLEKTGTGVTIASKAGLPDLAQHSFRLYVTFPSFPTSGSMQLLSPMGMISGSLVPILRLLVTYQGVVRIQNSSGTTVVSGLKSLVAGTRYRIEGQFTTTTGVVRIFEGDAVDPWDTITTAAGQSFGTMQVWRCGQLTSSPEFYPRLSAIQLRSDLAWIGPAAAPLAAGTSSRVAIIGDSLTAMNGLNGSANPLSGRPILDALQQRRYPLESVFHYGVGGKRMLTADAAGRTTPQTITDAAAVLGGIDHLVIALGTNDSPQTDAYISDAVGQLVAAAKTAGVPKLTWIGAVYEAPANPTAVRLNALISAALATVTGITVTFINPDPLIHDGRDESGWWVGDSTHMAPAGYMVRAQIYADAVAPVTP